MIKDMCQMMEFILWLILIKIVSQAVKRLKKVVMTEKHYNEKIMIMIIKKQYN